jgi:hypothetical protein
MTGLRVRTFKYCLGEGVISGYPHPAGIVRTCSRRINPHNQAPDGSRKIGIDYIRRRTTGGNTAEIKGNIRRRPYRIVDPQPVMGIIEGAESGIISLYAAGYMFGKARLAYNNAHQDTGKKKNDDNRGQHNK